MLPQAEWTEKMTPDPNWITKSMFAINHALRTKEFVLQNLNYFKLIFKKCKKILKIKLNLFLKHFLIKAF